MVCQFKSLFPELRVSQPLEIGVITHFQVLVVMSWHALLLDELFSTTLIYLPSSPIAILPGAGEDCN